MRAAATGLVAGLLAVLGCGQRMAEQPRYEPLEPSRFFSDGLSARHPVPGTVARGQTPADYHFLTGRKAAVQQGEPVGVVAGGLAAGGGSFSRPSLDRPGDYVDSFPYPVTLDVMKRGRERYAISCVPCHGQAGTGTGPVVLAGYPRAQSFHTDRLRQAPVGYLFDVVTRGYQQMPAYAGQIAPEDRWAVVAYVRALQLSQPGGKGERP